MTAKAVAAPTINTNRLFDLNKCMGCDSDRATIKGKFTEFDTLDGIKLWLCSECYSDYDDGFEQALLTKLKNLYGAAKQAILKPNKTKGNGATY